MITKKDFVALILSTIGLGILISALLIYFHWTATSLIILAVCCAIASVILKI